MKTKDLESRIQKLESALTDVQELLQVMNQRITHNSDGIDLVAGCPADPVGDIESMIDAITAIQELNPNNTDDEDRLHDISILIGKNLDNWGYGFEAARAIITYTAREAGFVGEHQPVVIHDCLMRGTTAPPSFEQ